MCAEYAITRFCAWIVAATPPIVAADAAAESVVATHVTAQNTRRPEAAAPNPTDVTLNDEPPWLAAE